MNALCFSSPSEAVEAPIDYAACLVKCTGRKALAARGNMSSSDLFVLLRVASHRIRHIYLLPSTAAFIRPGPRPPRKINSFVHFPTVEQRSLYNAVL